jgi:hypothetical protein|tara:strand:- start:1732 stop:2124 length:393 start_codon:yes stop_codon:yes gene_type:complete
MEELKILPYIQLNGEVSDVEESMFICRGARCVATRQYKGWKIRIYNQPSNVPKYLLWEQANYDDFDWDKVERACADRRYVIGTHGYMIINPANDHAFGDFQWLFDGGACLEEARREIDSHIFYETFPDKE